MLKQHAIAALQAHLQAELRAVEAIAAAARDETTSDETRQEGKYDTRAIEASYLARGQAERVAALRQLVSWFSVLQPSECAQVQVGALVQLERLGWLFVAPVGGHRVQVDGVALRMVSPSAPLGQAIADLEEGDVAEVEGPRGAQHLEVLQVR